MSAYRKRPAHLMDDEYEMISEYCDGFQTYMDNFVKAEEVDESIKKERAEIAAKAKRCGEIENMLTDCENLAMLMTGFAERKGIEDVCKKLRDILIEEKKRTVKIEQKIARLEEIKAELEEAAQDGIVDTARELVTLCEVVGRRREVWPSSSSSS